ncbi:uncharacterized protein LOC122719859 [Apis laboriosa]|uniref:uncharacterized protein LOC122719859 n=1 Tax=Apis laboriosa TaxID=183418 RepID=UPI001CC43DA3|nr:uncharacterized protein LOC122719859 [Apis laboriosa]
MPFAGEWCKVWIYFGFVFAWAKGARPRFDTSTDMGLVLVPADAEVDSVIFRLRATDQDADFPLVFEITATITPVVRIDNLPCTLYNKVCQANVILTKRLVPGRLHDFAVRVRDTKGDSNSMQATISVTNATTPRDKIFPHIPSLIMVPEDTKPGKELDYLLVRANSRSGKPVYIELWQPKELFTIRQRQTPIQTRGVIILTGELDFETQSMYTLTMYATDPYTEQGKDTRNIAGLSVVVIVQDVQDVPPIFTLAPPLTRINNSIQPGDIVVRVHAEDGDKGVPREIVYGLVSEGNPFTPFFNISETSGEITLARPLEELTQITHVGAPVVLTVVAEEIRRNRDEPPAQATVVDVGFLLGEPGNSPPYFESDNYIATIDENPEPGTVINFGEQYSTRVKDEDIGKAGVFTLKLENNNNTFEINPTVAERTADFVVTVRDNTLIDYELYKSLSFKIVAQEVGPATNLSALAPVIIFLRDVNDNSPIFDEESYEVTLSENVTEGSRVTQVHATDKDTGIYGSVRYTDIRGEGSEAFTMEPDTGLITVAMGSSLDREIAARFVLTVEARDENGNGNRGVVPLIVNLLDVNDNPPIFEKDVYEFALNSDLTNFTLPAFIKAIDADSEPPNNVVRYEIIHGNYENKFYLNDSSGELILLSPITKIRRKKQSAYDRFSKKMGTKFVKNRGEMDHAYGNELSMNNQNRMNSGNLSGEMIMEVIKKRRKRANDDPLYTLTARAYDLGVPHLSSETKIRILNGVAMEARIMMFVVPGEQPDSTKTAETLAAITGGRVTVLETRPYIQQNHTGGTGILAGGGGKKSIVIARVEQTEPGTSLVDVEKIRETLAANGVGIIGGTDAIMNTTNIDNTKVPLDGTPRHTTANDGQTTVINNTITTAQNEEVTVYKAENKLLFWLLIILGLLMLLAVAILIACCICPGCPFYMAPRKRRVHSSEMLVVRADGRPKRHLHRQPAIPIEVSWNGRKQAWSADPTRRNWQFNKRNVKNCSLPGDVAYISGQPNDIRMSVEAQRLRDGGGGRSYDHSRRSRMNEQERMYMEDIEDQKGRGYRTAELESLQRHEMDRGSDLQQQHAYRQRFVEHDTNEETAVREQHFFREGNAEVLRLVTRGQVEENATSHPQPHPHRPPTLIIDGKDIILQRFIEDQKSRHELSMQDIEAARSMESHQRSKDVCNQQPEIILIPERLELGHRQHVEEIGPNVQRLVIDHDRDYEARKEKESRTMRETTRQEAGSIVERPTLIVAKDQSNNAQYPFHDLELARQNVLLTRLLLEKENRRAGVMDSTSYLETQSLPGQVAIATQTDRTAATQTDRHVKSRSDNDESENEESRYRKRLRSRKKYGGDGDWRRSRTLWMKSPIEEEGSPCFDKRLSILRKKVREVKEGRKISLEPEVLREISDSLDGNGSSCKGEEDETMRSYRKSTEQTSISYKILNEKESGSSEERRKEKRSEEKSSEEVTDDRRVNNVTESSSPEIKVQREKHVGPKEKSPKRETRSKAQKSEGVIKPSFRILEKEFTLLTKKLSKLGDKKFQESSDSTCQEKSDSKEARKDSDQKSSKKMDPSTSQKHETTSKLEQKGKQRKDSAIAKTKQKLKYQQSQVMSTGSSELDDSLGFDKPKKPTRHESTKQKQSVGNHGKVKRLVQQMDRRESKKQVSESKDEETEKRKDGLSKGTPKGELKSEKIGKMAAKAPKLSVVSRKQNVVEETSTSTEEKREGERGAFAFEKKSSTDFSEKDSNGLFQPERERLEKKIIQKFSDDFVERSREDISEQKVTTSTEEDTASMEERKVGMVESSKNGIRRSEDLFEKSTREQEERVSSKKALDDSAHLHTKEQLITDIKFIDMGPIKKEELGKIVVRDQKVDKMASKVEPMKIKEPMKREDESIKYSEEEDRIKETKRVDELVSKSEKEIIERIRDKLEEYMERDKPLNGFKKQIETKLDTRLEEPEQEDRELSDTYKYLKEEIEKMSEDFKKKRDESKKTESEEEEEENVLSRCEHDIEDKNGARQKAEKRIQVEVHMPIEKEHNGKMGATQEMEKDVKSQVLSNEKDSMKFDITDVHIQDKLEEEKQVKLVDISSTDHIFEKEDSTKIAFNGGDKEKISLSMEIPHKEETTSMIETDKQIEESIFLDDREIDDKEKEDIKIKPDNRVMESIITSSEEKKISDEEKFIVKSIGEDYEKTMEDYKITEEISQDKKITEEIKDQKFDAETIVDYEVTEETVKDQKIDKEETKDHKFEGETNDTMEDDGISEKITVSRIEQTSKDEEVKKISEDYGIAEKATEDFKITEEVTTDHKMEEKVTEDYTIVGERFDDDKSLIKTDFTTKEEISDKKQDSTEIDNNKIKTKEIIDDHQISDKEIVPATLEIEEIPIAEKQDDIQEHRIEKEDVPPRISHVDKDDEIKEKEDSSKISTQEISMEVSIVPSIDDNAKQETSTDTESTEDHASKKDSVFSEMFKAVHSLVDKLTNGKRSRKTSVEEVAITELSDDKIIQKEVAHPDDDKEKCQEDSSITSEPSASRVSSDSIKLMEEQMDDKKITSKDKPLDSTDDKIAISPEETTGESMQIDIVSESKKTESDEQFGIDKDETIKLILEKPLLEKVEIDKPLKYDPASLIQPADEKLKDGKDTSEISSKKTIEISEESKEAIPDNERMDVKPLRITEEELLRVPTSSKASTSFQEIESLRSSSQTTTQEKEKLVSDSIISETSTDSAKTLEFEKQLKSAESKQIELQEMEEFVEGESFIVRASSPEGQSRSTESDVHTIVYRDESDKREDRTKGEMDKTLRKHIEEEGIPVEEEYVSLPLFTSIIDTMDDSEDSDSSSDISRKTTLTTRPYQTPRNRARQVSERESSQTEEVAESVGDEEQAILAVEVIGNGNVDSPKEERMLEKVEDAEQAPLTRSTEAVKGEETGSREEFINVQPRFSGEKLRATSDTEIDKESSTKHTKDTKSETKHGKDGKINREDEPSSASKLAKTDTFKVADKKAKEQERKKIPPQRKKKSCSEESPDEEKTTTHSHDAASHGGYRARGKPLEDRSRQKDRDKTKQGRRREESEKQKQFASRSKIDKDKKSSSGSEKYPTPSRSGEIDTSKTQPKYMAWYKKNREEMEKRRAELMATDDEEQLPRWLRRSMRSQRAEKEDKKQQSSQKTADTTPRTRRKVKPLVNVESEQLKAIVRQGRKLRRAEGGRNEDPPIQIFATTPPHDPKHHLVQHSEYKYEKAPAPFYLHPPPPPHPSPQLSPEHFEIPPTMECGRTDEEFDSGIAVSLQAGNRRHQQLLEKKSVFDIAYSEAAPSQLRSDSTTPPS